MVNYTYITVHYLGNVHSDVCIPTDMSSPTSTCVVIDVTEFHDTSHDVMWMNRVRDDVH